MPFFERDGLRLHYHDSGRGRPFVFQHGIGSDASSCVDLAGPITGPRLLAMDARGHGQSDLGPPDQLDFATLAEDVVALLDRLGIDRATMGGISMGAAISLVVALEHPQRVERLILSRPCWLHQPSPPNAAVFCTIGRLIREHGARVGWERFRQSDDYRQLEEQVPGAGASLEGLFTAPRAEETAEKFLRIAAGAPIDNVSVLRRIAVPALVLVTDQDPIHPRHYGELLRDELPRAELREITPKAVSLDGYAEDFRRAVSEFLQRS